MEAVKLLERNEDVLKTIHLGPANTGTNEQTYIEVGMRWLQAYYLHSLVIPGGGSSLCLGLSKHVENAGSRNHSRPPEAEHLQRLSKAL